MMPHLQQIIMTLIAMLLVLLAVFAVWSCLNSAPKITITEQQKMVRSMPSAPDLPMEHGVELPEPVMVESLEFASPIEEVQEESDDIQDILLLINDISREYEVDADLVKAIVECESGFDPNAISKTNDYGLMQINKCNHKSLSETLGITDFLDPKSNILAGVYILSTLKQYADTEEKLLMCYNLGVNGAKKKWSKGIYKTPYTEKVMAVKNGGCK